MTEKLPLVLEGALIHYTDPCCYTTGEIMVRGASYADLVGAIVNACDLPRHGQNLKSSPREKRRWRITVEQIGDGDGRADT